jgi:hypothetical protein
MKTFALMVFVRADSLDEARESWRENGQLDSGIFPEPFDQWPMWAKALRQFSKPEDNGIGDVAARIIGEENSEAFKAWYLATFKKSCGCTGRQKQWNMKYPLLSRNIAGHIIRAALFAVLFTACLILAFYVLPH